MVTVELDRGSNELMTDYPTRDSHKANITTVTSLHQLPILAEVTMDTPRKVMFPGNPFRILRLLRKQITKLVLKLVL